MATGMRIPSLLGALLFADTHPDVWDCGMIAT